MKSQRRQNVLTAAPTPENRKLPLKELIQCFILDCKAKNLSPLTLKMYTDCLNQLQKAFEEQNKALDVYTITARDIRQTFIGYLIDQGKSDNTINARIKGCKAFFTFLYGEGWIPNNIAADVHTVKAEKLMLQTFTKEQLAELLHQPDRKTFTGYRDYTMMMVLLETGMRISELKKLKVNDVYFKEQEIRITRGKGGKTRRVPIQRTCMKILRKYLDFRGDPDTDALFINLRNGPVSIRVFQEKLQEYGEQANIQGVRVSPHTFRHTMAKLYMLNGGDPFTLQKILRTRHARNGRILHPAFWFRPERAASEI